MADWLDRSRTPTLSSHHCPLMLRKELPFMSLAKRSRLILRLVLLLSSPLFLLWHFAKGLSAQGSGDETPLVYDQTWIADENTFGVTAAWGDFDGDGDLDLLTGSVDPCREYADPPVKRIYHNDGGILTKKAVWEASTESQTESLAWGDYDNDGDLDFVAGNLDAQCIVGVPTPIGAPNHIYRNDGVAPDGTIQFTRVWTSGDDSSMTSSVTWGDYDGDGDLDLAVGNSGGRDRIYRNDGIDADGAPILTLVWTGTQNDYTSEVAWGDYDNDGDLDLLRGGGAILSNSDFIEILRNEGNDTFTKAWEDPTINAIVVALSWGDVDGDGRLDIAVGMQDYTGLNVTGVANRVYRNLGSQAPNGEAFTLTWQSGDVYPTFAVRWGDADGDGDLDLAVGDKDAIRLYRNRQGTLDSNASWTSATSENTTMELAWGDVDGDGLLDLAAARQGRNLVFSNRTMVLPADSLSITGNDNARSIAWGDVDGDGDLDLALGGEGFVRVYANQGGKLSQNPIWARGEIDNYSLAWGDVDGDGDLDLITGNDGRDLLFRNNQGQLDQTPTWTSPLSGVTRSLAWGDVDGDGDLDLAVTQADLINNEFVARPNAIFLNQQGTLDSSPAWTSPSHADISLAVAWGDVDGDGDLDLVFANRGQSHLYLNRGKRDGGNGTTLQMVQVWSSAPDECSSGLALGDIDNDGDLDLVLGGCTVNKHRLYKYEYERGTFSDQASWSSIGPSNARAIALGDYDDDGDLDLAVARGGQQAISGNLVGFANQIYRNEGGQLATTPTWTSSDVSISTAAAWGDVDGDGDLDLAVANFGEPSRLYLNPRRTLLVGQNQPPRVSLVRPGITSPAHDFFSAEILRGNAITTPFSLSDAEGDRVGRVIAEYSLHPGDRWRPATPATSSPLLENLDAPSTGTDYLFVWDRKADGVVKSDSVRFRLRAQAAETSATASGLSLRWPAAGATSAQVRVEAPWYVRVGNADNDAVNAAEVYLNGELLGSTDRAGLIETGPLQADSALVARSLQQSIQTDRGAHDGWAYRVYRTSLDWRDPSNPAPFLVKNSGPQNLTLSSPQPLILYNLLWSVEWPATREYLAMLERAAQRANDYLFDASDGQIALGQVQIVDNRLHWTDADVTIRALNGLRPHATIGGIDNGAGFAAIKLGRDWSGTRYVPGDWDQPDGYRTLIHELGHYAFALLDEYEGFELVGTVLRLIRTVCTHSYLETRPLYASLMYYHYSASEFSALDVPNLWDETECEKTRQWAATGLSPWEVIANRLRDPNVPPRWQIMTPIDRGSMVSGPEGYPTKVLPSPLISITHAGLPTLPVTLTVVDTTGAPQPQVKVLLEKSGGVTIPQGETTADGRISLLGANRLDLVRVASVDGQQIGSAQINSAAPLSITLQPRSASRTTQSIPQLTLVPVYSSGSVSVTVEFRIAGVAQSAAPVVTFWAPGSSTFIDIIPDYQDNEFWSARYELPTAQVGSGMVLLQVDGEQPEARQIQLFYRLERVSTDNPAANPGQVHELFAEDGSARLLIPDQANKDPFYVIIATSTQQPSTLAEGQQMVKDPYAITLSRQRFDPGAILHIFAENLATDTQPSKFQQIGSDWVSLPTSVVDFIQNAGVTTNIVEPGNYALLLTTPTSPNMIYLPLVVSRSP
ncbi:hypothetical protein GC175_15005 [bacterium]|nr:hypothetical protein [bacterium]